MVQEKKKIDNDLYVPEEILLKHSRALEAARNYWQGQNA